MERIINDRKTINSIIENSSICHLGLAYQDKPYVIPISFGFDGVEVFFHTGQTGKKIKYFLENPNVCLQFENSLKVVSNENNPCKWSFSFNSVIGYGVIQEEKEKEHMIEALNFIMLHYSKREWCFSDDMLCNLRVWKVNLKEVYAKCSS